MCLWIPHLFPFEDTDSKGLPLILDRERCSFTVRLQPLSENDGINATAAVTTAQGVLLAHESPESYNPDFTRYFNEFSFSNKLLLADEVTYPEKRWNTLEEYYRDNGLTIDYLQWRVDMLNNVIPIPDEYDAQFEPNEWEKREPADVTGQAFGEIWVPVDSLRRGIDAEISFPCFADKT